MPNIRLRAASAAWPMFSAVLLFLAFLLFARSRAETDRMAEEARRCEAARQRLEQAIARTYAAELTLLGRRLRWPPLHRVAGGTAGNADDSRHKLVLLVSDITCNVCQDRATQFARLMTERHGAGSVMGIISAKDTRFVAAYIRVNGARFPMYLISHEDLTRLALPELPLLLLLTDDRVICAHQPHPGQERLSEAFHATVERLLREAGPNVSDAS